ncbi:hypothetical protein BGZ63DRAFT_386255 [Mariannaea sp. PMI_226]|nr:hypothetical protein BGZ63DRAFT_386255 [Mariannaea sp. PMI_226]
MFAFKTIPLLHSCLFPVHSKCRRRTDQPYHNTMNAWVAILKRCSYHREVAVGAKSLVQGTGQLPMNLETNPQTSFSPCPSGTTRN